MTLVLLSCVILVGGGLAAFVAAGNGRRSFRVAEASAVLAGVTGTVAAVHAAWCGNTRSLQLAWPLPIGSFHVGLDAISAVFLVPVFLVGAVAAVYGTAYLAHADAKTAGRSWLAYHGLLVSMVFVLIARDSVLFLLAWECMALTSFRLVVFDSSDDRVRKAGWLYLVSTHIGTAAVILFFLLAGRASGSTDFDAMAAGTGLSQAAMGVAFLLALVGFGAKAGFVPVHVWLPEAHPAAPSHVSAVMSGVMIKTGIYGLIRALVLLGPPAPWWGYVMIGVGVVSGVLGVLYAMAQHDVKRLLAYHSVENIGIIALGIGLGLLGVASGQQLLAAVGFAGALLHVVNHALFKGLLFLGAGSVYHATGTRQIDRLGGLLKEMPWTGALFLIGAAAISGLPPLNGFVSEFMVYYGAWMACMQAGSVSIWASLAVVAGLGLIGGLAAACFTKVFGIMFLGEPREPHDRPARESGLRMLAPMAVLGAACVLIGVLAPLAFRLVLPAAVSVGGGSMPAPESLASFSGILKGITGTVLLLAVLIACIALARRCLLRNRVVRTAGTWDCGYAAPTVRMQYTAASYAHPIMRLFGSLLGTKVHARLPEGLFPSKGAWHEETDDLFMARWFVPLFVKVRNAMQRLGWIQHGRLQGYILYVALTLLALIIWYAFTA